MVGTTSLIGSTSVLVYQLPESLCFVVINGGDNTEYEVGPVTFLPIFFSSMTHNRTSELCHFSKFNLITKFQNPRVQN